MTLLILLIVLTPLFFGLAWLADKKDRDGFAITSFSAGILTGCVLIIYIIAGGIQYSTALHEKAEIDLIAEKITVYENQQQQILENIKTEASKYADWESKTFKELKPDNVTVLFNAYPNLRTVEIITQYVAEIKNLQAKKFEQQIREIDIKRELRYYRESVITFIPL